MRALALIGIFLAFALFVLPAVFALSPTGANVTNLNSTSSPADDATSDNAFAGNVTNLNVFGISNTQAWQGYFGNVTGVIQLADGSDNVLYNWSQTSPRGQVYASTNNTIYWSNIQCFNFTANGSYNNEAGNGGTTNLYGTNLSILDAQYGLNITEGDPDSINTTFQLIGPGTHNLFYTASNQFNVGECQNTRVYDSSGGGVANHFEEVLLYEPVTTSVVFTSLLNHQVNGFDSYPHDFEMMVLENGHGTDVSTTPYYFFVELQ